MMCGDMKELQSWKCNIRSSDEVINRRAKWIHPLLRFHLTVTFFTLLLCLLRHLKVCNDTAGLAELFSLGPHSYICFNGVSFDKFYENLQRKLLLLTHNWKYLMDKLWETHCGRFVDFVLSTFFGKKGCQFTFLVRLLTCGEDHAGICKSYFTLIRFTFVNEHKSHLLPCKRGQHCLTKDIELRYSHWMTYSTFYLCKAVISYSRLDSDVCAQHSSLIVMSPQELGLSQCLHTALERLEPVRFMVHVFVVQILWASAT